MADNTTLPGTGDVIATDDIGGVKHQLVKIEYGAADSATQVDATNRLPVIGKAATTSGTLQSAASATGNGSSLDVTGLGSVAFLVTGSFNATVTFEGSTDGGSTWSAIWCASADTSIFGYNTTAAGLYRANAGGLTHVRARVTWTSGTSVTVVAAASAEPYAYPFVGISKIGNGWDIDLNSGTASTGTLRVVHATDVPVLSKQNQSSYTTLQNAANATGNGSTLDVTGMASVQFNVTGTFSSVVVYFEGSPDSGTTWAYLDAWDITGINASGGSATIVSGYSYHANCAGMTTVRARILWISGTSITIKAVASTASSPALTTSLHFGGLPAAVNSGVAGSTTLRVTHATDVAVMTKGSNNTGTLQNAVSATGNGSTLDVTGKASVVFVVTGTFTATVTFEGTADGSNWTSISAIQLGTFTIAATTTATGQFQASVSGLQAVRARVTWTSGTSVTVTAQANTGAYDSKSKMVKLTDGTLTVGAVSETGSSAVVAAAVGGGTPHDSVDSGNPIKIGARAIAHGTNPTAVAAADRTDLLANRAGTLFTIGGHPNVQTVRLQFTAAQTDVAVITVSTGTKIVVTAFQFTLDNASTVFPSVRLGFGTANTPTTSQVIGAHGGVPAGGGFGRGDGDGIIGIGADNEDLRITTVGAATGNGCELVVSYFTIES